jgi:hypothetical protein
MPFSINEFKAQIRGDLARNSHFIVYVHPKGKDTSDRAAALQFRIEQTNLPGRTAATVPNQIFGPIRQFAHNQTFQDLSVNIILSPDYREKTLMERWQDVALGTARGINGPREGMWDVGYYNNYVSTIEIKSFDDNGEEQFELKLIEAWPKVVGDVNLQWNSDEFARLPVTFAYRYYIDEDDGFYPAPSANTA